MDEKQVEACRKLGMTDEEIKEMLDDDKAIDRSNLNSKIFDWELSPEEHKKAVKFANSDERKKGERKKPVRKEDARKREIIQLLFDCLDENYGAVIDNPESILNLSLMAKNIQFPLLSTARPKMNKGECNIPLFR